MSLGTVLVLGGTSGIGLGLAIELIKSGSRVVIASSTQSKIDAAVSQLNTLAGGSEPHAFGHTIDLSDENTLEENVVNLLKFSSSPEVTGNTSGKINHIAHTAGESPPRVLLQDWSPVGAFKNWTVRYLTAVTLGKHAPAYLAQDGKSSLVFTSGTLAAKPIKGIATGIGSGGALEAFTRALAVEIAPIRVNTVAPGAIDTPLFRSFGGGSEEAYKAVSESFAQQSLLKKVGSVEDCAQAYLYLFRDSFQTGVVLRNDGGRLLV